VIQTGDVGSFARVQGGSAVVVLMVVFFRLVPCRLSALIMSPLALGPEPAVQRLRPVGLATCLVRVQA